MAESKRTPYRVEIILSKLRLGNSRRAAYALARISGETFYAWMREDPEFADKVRLAEAQAESEWLALILADAKPPDRIKMMEKRFREDWAERIEVEHRGGVSINYVNDWRGSSADAPSGTETSTL